jgi:hypothetical protein
LFKNFESENNNGIADKTILMVFRNSGTQIDFIEHFNRLWLLRLRVKKNKLRNKLRKNK